MYNYSSCIITEEMIPLLFDYKDIPFDQMWADDKYWFPLLLELKKFIGYFHFAQVKYIHFRDVHLAYFTIGSKDNSETTVQYCG